MRTLFCISYLIFLYGCSGSKSTGSEGGVLNGSWLPVQQEIGGKPLPKAVYEKQQLIIADTNYTVIAESVDKGVIRYSGADKLDIYGKDGVNAGKHFSAIYKYENEQLTICYNLQGNGYPEAYDTKGKIMFFMSVFRKVDPK